MVTLDYTLLVKNYYTDAEVLGKIWDEINEWGSAHGQHIDLSWQVIVSEQNATYALLRWGKWLKVE